MEQPRKLNAIIAATAVVLGNVAAIIVSIREITELLFKLIGYQWLSFLFLGLLILTLLGYGGVYWWLHRKFGRRKLVVAAAILVVAVVAALANFVLYPSKPDPRMLLAEESSHWVDRIIALQEPNHGFRTGTAPGEPTQVWTTAQSLKAVLAGRNNVSRYAENLRSAFEYIEQARETVENEGWGYWQGRPWTITEIAGWVTVAYIEAIETGKVWDEKELPEILSRVERELDHLRQRQHSTGGWSPIRIVKESYTRTYSTVMALWALIEARRSSTVYERIGSKYDGNIRNGIHWLLNNYDPKLGFVPNPHRRNQNEPFWGLTAHALFVLSRAENDFDFLRGEPVYRRLKAHFLDLINFFDRRISQNERLSDRDQHFPDVGFQLEGSTFLWFPWSLLVANHLSTDVTISEGNRERAADLRVDLLSKVDDLVNEASEAVYVMAENLFALSHTLQRAGEEAP